MGQLGRSVEVAGRADGCAASKFWICICFCEMLIQGAECRDLFKLFILDSVMSLVEEFPNYEGDCNDQQGK